MHIPEPRQILRDLGALPDGWAETVAAARARVAEVSAEFEAGRVDYDDLCRAREAGEATVAALLPPWWVAEQSDAHEATEAPYSARDLGIFDPGA